MSIKLVKLGKFLESNEEARNLVSDAYARGIVNGVAQRDLIANNLHILSQTIDSGFEFTLDEILDSLPQILTKSEKLEKLIRQNKNFENNTANDASYNRISLYNSGAFVCDMLLYTPTIYGTNIYDGDNICAGQTDSRYLVWFEGMGLIKDGDSIQMKAYVYTGEDDPVSDIIVYNKNANKSANFEVYGTTCNVKFCRLADTDTV